TWHWIMTISTTNNFSCSIEVTYGIHIIVKKLHLISSFISTQSCAEQKFLFNYIICIAFELMHKLLVSTKLRIIICFNIFSIVINSFLQRLIINTCFFCHGLQVAFDQNWTLLAIQIKE